MDEVMLSRKYLADNLSAFTNRKLDLQPDGVWLCNPASNATHNTCLIAKPDAQLGMVRIVLGKDASPQFGRKGAHWLVLHEPIANKVWMIAWEDFVFRTRESAASAGMQFIKVVPQPAGGFHVLLNLDWAVASHTARRVEQIKSSYLKFRENKLATPEQFVHLHNHSTYSLLDGASSIEGIADTAIANGQSAIALTDHGYMFSAYKHWAACVKRGIKPIMGVEAYVVDDVAKKYVNDEGVTKRWEFHQTLIAMNQEGWENLCKLMTAACRDNVYYVPRIDHQMLLQNNAGIICLTGCFKGMAAHYLQKRPLKEGETKLPHWLERNPDESQRILLMYKAAFGDRLYGEVMGIDYQPYNEIVPELCDMLDALGIPKVATVDAHYEREEDAILQAVLTRISNQRVDSIGEGLKEKGCYYIRPRAEVPWNSPYITGDMMDRTCEVAARCDLSFERKGYLFPQYDLSKDNDWAAYQGMKKTVVSVPDAKVLARTTDPDTSHEAATHIVDSLAKLHTWVIECIKQRPGMTAKELASVFSSDDERRLGRRLKECWKYGWITPGPKRPCQVTGRNARVWFPAGQLPAGVAAEAFVETQGDEE